MHTQEAALLSRQFCRSWRRPTCSARAGGALAAAAVDAPNHPPAPGSVARADEIRRLVDYIDENYAKPILLRDLNRLSALTVFQIIRAFRRETGTTPHAYLIAVRIDRAAARLASGETIAGAAAEAGFSDQSHFGRHFKRRFGKTPREFAGSDGTS